ncbi:hypothetical protein [Streptomyces sp. NPDC002853]
MSVPCQCSFERLLKLTMVTIEAFERLLKSANKEKPSPSDGEGFS